MPLCESESARSWRAADQSRFRQQIDRMDEVLSVLTGLRRGMTVREVHSQLERYSVCERTVRRDLEMLECIGRVEATRVPRLDGHGYLTRWRKLKPLFATDAG